MIFKSYSCLKCYGKCGECAGLNKKTLENYKTIADKDKGEYILDIIPKNAQTKIKGWKCKACEKLYCASYMTVREGKWCPCKIGKNKRVSTKRFLSDLYENI